eukprot:11225646-Lingulodinium_polyedra.AAC.1
MVPEEVGELATRQILDPAGHMGAGAPCPNVPRGDVAHLGIGELLADLGRAGRRELRCGLPRPRGPA